MADSPSVHSLAAPIVAVTVFPDRARITRRARVSLPAGEHRIAQHDLPVWVVEDSVRVAGIGSASLLGVDLVRSYPSVTPDETYRGLEEALRAARSRLAAIDDDDAVATQRLEFYRGLADRSTRTFAAALAGGSANAARVNELAATIGEEQAAVLARRRELRERRESAQREVEAAQRELEARQRGIGQPSVAIVATVHSDSDVDLELDMSYVVTNASWRSTYDVRLDAATLALTWYGLVSQNTGEDWPECDLRLSTARPSGAATVPELDPWFLDRRHPQPPPRPMAAPATAGRAMTLGFGQAAEEAPQDAYLYAAVAVPEQGATAATYQPTRPVAVPADGSAHRATVAIAEFVAKLDYVTAPVRAAEANLRATVTNTSPHTLPAGDASVFHAGDFVGTTRIEVWAPGEEVELALGVDDRIRIERELVRRTASKPMLGARRREAEHRIRVTNHTPNPATVTVLDQLPVSRDDAITVKEQRLDPAPAERTDLGVLTWVLELAAGETRDIHIGVRVDVARGAELVGWRE